MASVALLPGAATPTFFGRANTFRTPGRAGTSGQKVFSLFNAVGSGTIITLNHLSVDMYQTVVKAVTVAPPLVRVHRLVVVPTQGTVLTKVSRDSSQDVSNASVTVRGDASADGTSSAVTLVAAPLASSILAQVFAPRLITAAGYEAYDRMEFFEASFLRLLPGEGMVVELAYTLATQNPVTDMWIVSADWDEALS